MKASNPMTIAYVIRIDRKTATVLETKTFELKDRFERMKAIETFFGESTKHTYPMPKEAWAVHLSRGYTETETTKIVYYEVEIT